MWNTYMNYLARDVDELIADNQDMIRIYYGTTISDAVSDGDKHHANTENAVLYLQTKIRSLAAIGYVALTIRHLTLARYCRVLCDCVLEAVAHPQLSNQQPRL